MLGLLYTKSNLGGNEMGMFLTYDYENDQPKLEKRLEDEPLWSLVDDGCESTCVVLLGETPRAREDRLAGRLGSDGKVVLRPLSAELNQFINANRKDGRHEMLITLVAAVMCEAAMLEASKILARQRKTISTLL
jgi:hypothetical protein